MTPPRGVPASGWCRTPLSAWPRRLTKETFSSRILESRYDRCQRTNNTIGNGLKANRIIVISPGVSFRIIYKPKLQLSDRGYFDPLLDHRSCELGLTLGILMIYDLYERRNGSRTYTHADLHNDARDAGKAAYVRYFLDAGDDWSHGIHLRALGSDVLGRKRTNGGYSRGREAYGPHQNRSERNGDCGAFGSQGQQAALCAVGRHRSGRQDRRGISPPGGD